MSWHLDHWHGWGEHESHAWTDEDPARTVCGETRSATDIARRAVHTRRWPSCERCRAALGLATPVQRAHDEGYRAAVMGARVTANPYPDLRTDRGGVTWSRARNNAWYRGYCAATGKRP